MFINKKIDMATSHNAIKKNTDNLKHYPNVEKTTFDVITIGDLHGSALKLLHFLLQNHIVYWDTSEKFKSEAFYQRFYELYNVTTITQDHLNELRSLISSLRVAPNTPLLRFIGDELADRGKNDLITLLIFDHLKANGVNYRCILSNHAHKFLMMYRQIRSGQPIFSWEYPACYHSQTALFSCIGNGFIEIDEVNRLVDNHKNHLYILDHGLYDQGTYQYTHAITSHTIGRHLAQKLNLFYVEATPLFRVWSTSRVNQAFRQRLMCDDWSLYQEYIMEQLIDRYEIDEGEYPFECTLWNRTYSSVQRPKLQPEYAYEQRSIHGHQADDPLADDDFIISLDSLFGKGTNDEGINPIFYHQETVLSPEELTHVESQVKDHIRNDLEAIEGATLPALEYLDLLNKKTDFYQQAFVDPTFSEIYPLIIRLIERKYRHQMTSMFSLENSNTMPFSKEMQSFISTIQQTIHWFKKHQFNTQNLDQIMSDLNEKSKLRQNTEQNIQSFSSYIWKKQNFLAAHGVDLPALNVVFKKFNPLFNDPQITSGERIRYFTENAPFTELQRAALDDCQTLLSPPSFDVRFIQRSTAVLTILKELNTQDILQKQLQEELNCAKEYYNKQKYAQNFKNFIDQSDSQYPNNPLCETLRQLVCAYADRADDQLINFSTRTTSFDNHLSEICSNVRLEIERLQKDSRKDLTAHEIKCLLTHISFLKKLNKQIEIFLSGILQSSAASSDVNDKRLNVATTIDFQKPLLVALEQQTLNAQAQLDSLSPLRKALIVSCHYYQTHLSQQGLSTPNENKKKIVADMLDTLALKDELQRFSKSSINTFIQQFNANQEILKSRQSILGVPIENQGKMRTLLNFFQHQEKIKLSQGSTFIDEIKKTLLRYEEVIASIQITSVNFPFSPNMGRRCP